MKNEAFLYEAIVSAINSHALPRPYDWIILIVACATFIASIIVAIFSYNLNKKQKDIAKKQAEISEKQTEIMEQQNKIALFDKRFEIYRKLEQLTINQKALPKEFVLELFHSKELSQLDKAKTFFHSFFARIVNFNSHDIAFANLCEEEQAQMILKEFENLIIELKYMEFIFEVSTEDLLLYNNYLSIFTTIFGLLLIDRTTLSFAKQLNGTMEKRQYFNIELCISDLAAYDKLHLFVVELKEQLKVSSIYM